MVDKDRLSDALLKDLIEHFSLLLLGNQQVDSDVFSNAYEYLIKKFADATNKKAGGVVHPAQCGPPAQQQPELKPFRKWVTSEVLPTIRKTGSRVAHQQHQVDHAGATSKTLLHPP